MSEFQTRPWLEMELATQLSPAAAPESLWDRIQEQPVARRGPSFRWGLWPVAAAVLLTVGGAIAWRIGLPRDPVSAMEKLAAQELRALAAGPARVDFRSADPTEIRAWVKARTNIDIELPRERSGRVRLLGARLIPLEGAPVAAVCYQVGNDTGTLLVASARLAHGGSAAAVEHTFSPRVSLKGARLYSWHIKEQVYTLASSSAKDPQAACLLCHAEGGHPTLGAGKGKNGAPSLTGGGIL